MFKAITPVWECFGQMEADQAVSEQTKPNLKKIYNPPPCHCIILALLEVRNSCARLPTVRIKRHTQLPAKANIQKSQSMGVSSAYHSLPDIRKGTGSPGLEVQTAEMCPM